MCVFVGVARSAIIINEGDPDDDGVELSYSVTAVTTNGVLRLSGTELVVSDTFTQADVDANDRRLELVVVAQADGDLVGGDDRSGVAIRLRDNVCVGDDESLLCIHNDA